MHEILAQFIESHEAIHQYQADYGIESCRMIKVIKDNYVVLEAEGIDIIIGYGKYNSDLREVHIHWEKAGLIDYWNYHLYGTYSSLHFKMEYISKTLIIYSYDIKIEIC